MAYVDPVEHMQQQEYRRQQIVERAMSAAERIILAGSDGSVEETDFLTAEMALKYTEKVHMAIANKLGHKELQDRLRKELEERHV